MWILSLCGATALTSLFKILLSNSSLNKVVNIFFSIFILFYTVIPIQSFSTDINLNSNFSNEKIEYSDIYKSGYEKIVEASIVSLCKNENVNLLYCEIESYINEDGYLYVEQIDIDIDDNEKINSLKQDIKNQLGYEVNIT